MVECPPPACPPCGAEAVLPFVQAITASCLNPVSGKDVADGPINPFELLSLRRPRDAIAGAASGLKTATRSLAAGVAYLATHPAEHLSDGPLPALKGLGEGLLTATLLPCAGLAVAATQAVRGVANTPQALVEALRGRQWDEQERCWVSPGPYSLPEEYMQVRRRRAQADAHDDGRRRRRVNTLGTVKRHGTCYYSILRVQPSASDTELRRAYHRECLRCHPDKVGGDPLSVAHFQRLSEAYNALRSPELRAVYDRGGSAALERRSRSIDLGELYAAAMSGASWEPHLGKLALSRLLAQSTEEEDCQSIFCALWWADEEIQDLVQLEREVECAMALAARLQLAVDFDLATFQREMGAEAAKLAALPFAPGLLLAMASVYDSEAERFQRSFSLLDFGREATQVRARVRSLSLQARAAVSGVRVMLQFRKLLKEQEEQGEERGAAQDDQGQGPPVFNIERLEAENQLPVFAQAFWQLTLLDVEATLRRSCRRVLRDQSVSLTVCSRRAEALQALAGVLREAAQARAQSPGAGAAGEDEEFLSQHVRQVMAGLATSWAA